MNTPRDGSSISLFARLSLWAGIFSSILGVASLCDWFDRGIYFAFMVSWGLTIVLAVAGGLQIQRANTPVRGVRRALGGALLPLPLAMFMSATSMSDMDGRQPTLFGLRIVGMGLQSHDETTRRLPPAVVKDKDGADLLSWRVSLLPFTEHPRMLQEFKLDEAWDSPHNVTILPRMPYCYGSQWANERDATYFQAFVGPGTAFEPTPVPLRLSRDFPDGTAHTFLIVEAQEAVPWTKPQDLNYDPKLPVPPLGRSYTVEGRFLRRQLIYSKHGFLAVFADGSARFIRSDIDEHVLRAAIERNDGKKPDWDPPAWDGRRDFWGGH